MSNAATDAAGRVIERFVPSIGRWLGYLGVALGAATAVAGASDEWPDNWQVVGLGIAISAISWVVLIRPAVSLHEHGVLLRNMMRDTFVPASKIEKAKSAQTLMIRTEEGIFHGLGVSKSARSMMREQRGPRQNMMSIFGGMSGSFGAGSAAEPAEPVHRFANEERTGGTYQAYVESRIERAAQDAKPDELEVVVAWALAPVAAVVIAVVSIVLFFF